MMIRSNIPQVLGAVSQLSGKDYEERVDDMNPWPGDFESDVEDREYVNQVDLPGDFESDVDDLEYVNQDEWKETDVLYETVDELRQRSKQSNLRNKDTKRLPNALPDAQVATDSNQPPQMPRPLLSSFEIDQGVPPGSPHFIQEDIYTNVDDNIPDSLHNQPIKNYFAPPAVPSSHLNKNAESAPPVPTGRRPALFPPNSEVPSVPVIPRTSPVPPSLDVASASTTRIPPSCVPPSIDGPASSPAVQSASPTPPPIPVAQTDQNSLAPGSAMKRTPSPVSTKICPKEAALTESQVWYVGDCSPSEADELLMKVAEEGTFVVRNSQRSGHSYTLCVFHEQIRRFPIRHRKEDGNFALGTPKPNEIVFSSVAEMIHFYRNNPIEYGKERSKVTLGKAATE